MAAPVLAYYSLVVKTFIFYDSNHFASIRDKRSLVFKMHILPGAQWLIPVNLVDLECLRSGRLMFQASIGKNVHETPISIDKSLCAPVIPSMTRSIKEKD
jgi:hypothetical protein